MKAPPSASANRRLSLCIRALGDTVLRRVASVIRAHCRQDDLPVRYGGDEFLLVLAGTDLATGTRVLERLKRAGDACLGQAEAPGLKVTLSIAIAMHVRGSTISETIAATDHALYSAKAAGRDRIVAKKLPRRGSARGTS